MDLSAADDHRGARRDADARLEVLVGAVLVLVVVFGGLYLALRPASGAVDGWVLDRIGSSRSDIFNAVTATRQPWVVVIGSAIACACTIARDLPRAIAVLVAPPAALAVCELVAKPLVGRTLGGNLSYPSGSTVGAAALACAAVLATPPAWRAVTITIGSAYALWMSLAVVALRWHYPTDALAGVATGVGIVLLADGLAWIVDEALVRARARHAAAPHRR